MTSLLGRFRSRAARLRDEEEGTSTVEFVIIFPIFMTIFFASFETGYMMVRNVMLERGLDYAVRELRLGTPAPPTFDEFKETICERAVIISDCMNVVQVQLEPVNMTTWGPLDETPRCIDIESTIDPINATNYVVGRNNELMLVRVCALFKPFFPTTGLGLMTRYNERGDYALVATSAFVNEPSR